jgi:hypothetical protein
VHSRGDTASTQAMRYVRTTLQSQLSR